MGSLCVKCVNDSYQKEVSLQAEPQLYKKDIAEFFNVYKTWRTMGDDSHAAWADCNLSWVRTVDQKRSVHVDDISTAILETMYTILEEEATCFAESLKAKI